MARAGVSRGRDETWMGTPCAAWHSFYHSSLEPASLLAPEGDGGGIAEGLRV